MKNNIKKAPVKFRDDLLYFQHFIIFLFLPQISDYHHLKGNIGFLCDLKRNLTQQTHSIYTLIQLHMTLNTRRA